MKLTHLKGFLLSMDIGSPLYGHLMHPNGKHEVNGVSVRVVQIDMITNTKVILECVPVDDADNADGFEVCRDMCIKIMNETLAKTKKINSENIMTMGGFRILVEELAANVRELTP